MAHTANASTVNKVGYYVPVALFAAVLLSVGSGLIATFSPSTPTGKWIGYQILYGAGRGLGLQMVCLIFPIIDPSAHLVTLFFLGSHSSRFKIQCHPHSSPSPWRSSCSANRLEQPYSSVSQKLHSAIVLHISSPNTHLRSMVKGSLMLGLLDSEKLFREQILRVY